MLQVYSLSSASVRPLQGLGIETTDAIAPWPMPRHFAEQWKQNHARFPRGVDLLIAGAATVTGLPRTTRLSRADSDAPARPVAEPGRNESALDPEVR